MRISKVITTDYLVIGSGLAGLYFAAHASKHGKVLIVTKKNVKSSNTYHAQAGIAAALGDDDTKQRHAEDTIKTGAGLCNEKIVNMVVEDAPSRIHDLADTFNVKFDKNEDGSFNLTKEGGHTRRRVAHIDDFTGMAVIDTMMNYVKKLPNVKILENHMAVDLLSMAKYGESNACFGAFILDVKSGAVDTCLAKATILATGGAGKVYLYTSNPDVAVGDGIAMAYRIGADIANMEFYQFHPTCLYHPKAKSFLISESLRGEGGILKRADGTAFMPAYHPMADLAPRDVVARAIDHELKKSGDDSVFLDMTHLESDFLKKRFPNIYAKCLTFGIDMSETPIPVVPAAHYSCGGVVTDENGETTVPHLFAIGEVAHTGLHGACRMASNSLLEALVFAKKAADKVKDMDFIRPLEIIPWESGNAISSDEGVIVSHNWDEIRRTMWNYVGIMRSNKRLERAQHRIDLIRKEIKNYYWDFLLTPELLELRNLALVADLIVFGASGRLESRGLHFNLDYPETSEFYKRDTVLRRGTGPKH